MQTVLTLYFPSLILVCSANRVDTSDDLPPFISEDDLHGVIKFIEDLDTSVSTYVVLS